MAALVGLTMMLHVAAAVDGTDVGGFVGDNNPPVVEDVVEEPPPPVLNMAVERRLDCIEGYESHGDPGATNPRSKAAGLFQFLGSTWAGTPQGRAGLSPYDPIAAREAARWMAGQGRWREWVPVQNGWC